MSIRIIPLLLGTSLLASTALAQAGDNEKMNKTPYGATTSGEQVQQDRQSGSRNTEDMDEAPYGPTSSGNRTQDRLDDQRDGTMDNNPADRESIQEDWRRNAEDRKESDIRNPVE